MPDMETAEKPETQEPVQQPTEERDYDTLKAKYEALKESSRKWETRSKANAEKAKAYDELAESQAQAQASAEDATKRIEEIEAKLADATRQIEVARIASEKGVDADILGAMTGDDIAANADKLAASYAARHIYPSVSDSGAVEAPAVTTESIEAVKDPKARIMERAAHIDLYK